MTRRALIEQIRRLYYGGVPSDDATLTEKEVNQYISQAIAYMAKVNYSDSIKIEGIETVSDAFYTTFKNLTLAKDVDTGYWYTSLPHPPIGLSRGYGISSVTFAVNTGLAKAPVPISPRELDLIDNMKKPPSKIFYWAEGGRLYFKSPYYNLDNKSPIVRMITAEVSNLDSDLTVPVEYVSEMVSWIMNQLTMRKGMQEDTTNDGLDKV